MEKVTINHHDSFKMKMMKKFYYILFVFCSITTLFAQKKVSVKQANTLFASKSYVKAAEAYEQVIQTKQTKQVLQNLGDCYYYNFQMTNAVRAYGQLFFTFKDSVKKAVSFVSNFENTAAEIAIEKKYSYVVCGHIHKPQMKVVKNENGKVLYLNSGDWVENLTALEYKKEKWSIYQYKKSDYLHHEFKEDIIINDIVNKILS